MVKAVVGEEARLKFAEDRLSQSAIPSQVGLVIGKLSSALDRGFVFDLVPTPPNDAGDPASSLTENLKDDKKKGPKSKSQAAAADSSSLSIDRDWVAEHARQVSRMLTGGMKVVGIYVWVSDSAFKNSTMMLCQTVKGVAEVAPFMETDSSDRLLIHICYSPRRWTCRNCSLASNITSSSLRPCDFKMGKVFSSLQTFKCTYNFDLRLPIFRESGSNGQTLTDFLRQGISVHARELKSAKAVIDGNLVVNDEPSTSNDSHEVELLLPFMNSLSAEACSQNDALGVLVFSGSVCSFAYMNLKEPISQAVAVIKEDIITSLQSRLDIISDEADGDMDQIDGGGKETSNDISTGKPASQLTLPLLRETCSLSLPRRVFVPWLASTFICDYLQASETLEVVKDHCVELMSLEPPADASSTILEPEIEVPTMIIQSFWETAASFCVGSDSSFETRDIAAKEESNKSVMSANFSITTAIFVLVLSILVGCFLFLFRRS